MDAVHSTHAHGHSISTEQHNYMLKFGWWLYIASEVMLFSSLIAVFLLAKRLYPEQLELLEVGPLRGKSVQVRRLDPGMAVAGQFAPSPVVGEDEDDVGLRRKPVLWGRKSEEHQESLHCRSSSAGVDSLSTR